MTSNRFPHLLSAGRIGTMELRNRIAVTAMGVSLSEDDGSVGERLIAYHEEQAKGGVGLIISGVTGVAWPVGCVAMGQTAISDDKFLPGLKQLTDRVHAHGAKIAAQLHHGGLVAGYAHARWGHPLWAPAIPPAPKGNFTEYFLMEELAGLAGMKLGRNAAVGSQALVWPGFEGRQFLRGEEGRDRRRGQGQSSDLYRRRIRRRENQYRRGHDHL